MFQFSKRPTSERDPFRVPRSAQQTIPIRRIYRDGIWELGGGLYSRTWRFSDINYAVASPEHQESLFLLWQAVLNSQPTDANTKITLVNQHLNRNAFQRSIFLPGRSDGLDRYRAEYNQMLMDKAVGSNGMVQDRYITTTARFRQVEEARSFYARVGTELSTGLGRLGSSVRGLDNAARLQVLHDFFRSGEEGRFSFDLNELIRRGRDFRDLICPDSIQFKANHFLLGESRYGRVLFLKEYASILPDSLIPELADLPKNLMLSIDIQPVPTDTALRDLQRTTMAVESDMTRWQRRQNENYNFSADPPYDLRQMREVAKAYLDDLTTRDQRMMLVTITLTHLADSLEELDSDTAALTAIGNKYGCEFAPLIFRQETGLNTALPYGHRRLDAKRTLTTETTAILMPFSSQEIRDEGGLFYGVNPVSRNLIVCNRKRLLNGNGFILGVSGSGKSFAAKEEITSVALSTPDDIILVDPEGEYSSLVRALYGEVIKISASSPNHINAMDMSREYGGESNPLILKADFIMSLCEQLMGRGKLEAHGKSIIDRCMADVYEGYDYNSPPPTLNDLYMALLKQTEPEARDIALALELFTRGSLNIFAHQTNVNMNSRILCFDIHDLGKQLKTVGMLVMLDAILNRITSNRKKNIRTWVYIDEIYLFFANEFSSEFLSESWKRFRKYGALATGLTQNLEDCLRSPMARTMLSNSEFLLLLNQASTDRQELASLLNISETQMLHITNTEAGRGLIKVGAALVPFVNDFPHDTQGN